MQLKYSDFSLENLFDLYPVKKDYLLITIPCYAEEDILTTLYSIDNCDDCGLQPLIIILINSPVDIQEDSLKLNKKVYEEVSNRSFNRIKILPIHVYEIPNRVAGVGLARRMAMDLASYFYSSIGNQDLPILCLDADSTVEKNYLSEIFNFFSQNSKIAAVSIHFEHPYEEISDVELRNGIIDYELHLRYFIEAQRWAGHPHAFQTIGSSMAVRSIQYRLQGGMNKRKAGEDFYFLHKFSRIGTLADLTTTTVYPAVRVSERVPFGTGKALKDIKSGLNFTTYSLKTFEDLKNIIDELNVFQMDSIDDLKLVFPQSFMDCFGMEKIQLALEDANRHSSSHENFLKRFYYWFDAFKVFKFAHYCRDHFYPNQAVFDKVNDFLIQKMSIPGFKTKESQLDYFRQRSRAK